MPDLQSCIIFFMDINKLCKIRNLLREQEGDILLDYLHNCLTEQCTKNISPELIKGFGLCIQKIKDIPKVVENRRN